MDANPRPFCNGCKGPLTPVFDPSKKTFITKYFTCKPCADTGKTTYWDYPFKYEEVLVRHGYIWLDRHPEYPTAFIETEVARLSENLQRITTWKPGDKASLLLHGTTGTGKTRAAWLIFNRIWADNFPDKAVWLPMRKLEMAIEKGFDEHKHGKVLDYFCTVPLLAFDDLGKERLTARMESDLFAIIDERTSNLRPTIITTNYNGTTLLDRFNNKETGEALLRRIREYYTAVHA
jgi:hypothetical protein